MSKFRRVLITLAMASAVVAPAAVMATPASAASPGVYIVTPKSWGWCPNIRGITNQVAFVSITNTTTGYSQTDGGDDIGWSAARLNARNTVYVNVGCSLGYGSTGTVVTITPNRNGQAFFVSPTGASWGN